jgi:hypothetical protein
MLSFLLVPSQDLMESEKQNELYWKFVYLDKIYRHGNLSELPTHANGDEMGFGFHRLVLHC